MSFPPANINQKFNQIDKHIFCYTSRFFSLFTQICFVLVTSFNLRPKLSHIWLDEREKKATVTLHPSPPAEFWRRQKKYIYQIWCWIWMMQTNKENNSVHGRIVYKYICQCRQLEQRHKNYVFFLHCCSFFSFSQSWHGICGRQEKWYVTFSPEIPD